MVGGSPISQKYANEIGADGYSANAVGAVKTCKKTGRDKLNNYIKRGLILCSMKRKDWQRH